MAHPLCVRIGSAHPSNPRVLLHSRAGHLIHGHGVLRSSRVGATLAPGGPPRSGCPENVHPFRQRSPLRWLLQERPALCMGRFVAALLEEDAEWLTWI